MKNYKLFNKPNYLIKENDIVYYMETKDVYKYIRVKVGESFQNKYGHFCHDDFIGKEKGTKIFTKSKKKIDKDGYVLILDFMPSNWDKTGERLTQILYSPDISLILTLLNINNNDIILESGTGSGCLTINIANALSNGHLFTFEFNKERALKVSNKLNDLNIKNAIVINQDVLEYGFNVDNYFSKYISSNDQSHNISILDKFNLNYSNKIKIGNLEDIIKLKEDERLLYNKIDSIFIDLPSPWGVIESINNKLKYNGRLVSFSPCIEQISKTIEKLKEYNYMKPRIFEIQIRGYNYVKTERVKVPCLGVKRNLNFNNNYIEQSINISTSRNDMKGHTGFLLFTVKL